MNTYEAVKGILARFLNLRPEDIRDDQEMALLVRNSFQLVELVMTLQEDLDILVSQEDFRGVTRVAEFISVFTRGETGAVKDEVQLAKVVPGALMA